MARKRNKIMSYALSSQPRREEDVLADRCITIILEKSNNVGITKLLEIFDYGLDITTILRKSHPLEI